MSKAYPGSTDARNKFEDLSGVDPSTSSNPYDALLLEGGYHDFPVTHSSYRPRQVQIQSRYSAHRTNRNLKQKEEFLLQGPEVLILDTMLQRLEDPSIEPGFVDPRNCLVFWARPPSAVRDLVDKIQQKIRIIAPRLSCPFISPFGLSHQVNAMMDADCTFLYYYCITVIGNTI